ncbi:flagellin [Bacillus cytotoxicus]|uniref:flagellin N-terminal helical domain-containing protein n=1 Tax=unclassified Bacillus cereus group TaxID=2750818 RepID=UPI001F58D0DA|nr:MULTISPECIES: flagellin [unclassified Bacillus cereus group]EMA6341844.1 flagellin [Bacillus cytotoxicus]
MKVGTNIQVLHMLNQNETYRNQTAEHFTTRKRMNPTTDYDDELALTTRMHVRNPKLHIAIRNNENAISLLRKMETSLQTINRILIRMRDIAVQTVSGINSSVNQNTLDKEFRELIKQISYISNTNSSSDILSYKYEDNIKIVVNDFGNTINLLSSSLQKRQQINNSSSKPTNIIASTAINKIDLALQTISLYQEDIKTLVKRLYFNIERLTNHTTTMVDATPHMKDADIVKEMSEFVKDKLLTEITLSTVSQANQVPQMILKLLQL